MANREHKTGEIIKVRTGCAEGNPHSFLIQELDDEGNRITTKTYFAHLGDLFENEQKLYGNRDETVFLEEGQRVEFNIITDSPYTPASSVKTID